MLAAQLLATTARAPLISNRSYEGILSATIISRLAAHSRDRAQQRLGLARRLVPLALRHRVGDDPRAGLDRSTAAVDHARADRNGEIHPLPAGRDVAECSRVRSACDRLQLVD